MEVVTSFQIFSEQQFLGTNLFQRVWILDKYLKK